MTTQPHSYDNDPIYQAGIANAFNSGIGQAALIVMTGAQALAGTNGAAVGEMPTMVPASVLETLYADIMSAQKVVPAVPDGAA